MITFRNYFLQNFFWLFSIFKNNFVTFGQNLKTHWDWGTHQVLVYRAKFDIGLLAANLFGSYIHRISRKNEVQHILGQGPAKKLSIA